MSELFTVIFVGAVLLGGLWLINMLDKGGNAMNEDLEQALRAEQLRRQAKDIEAQRAENIAMIQRDLDRRD